MLCRLCSGLFENNAKLNPTLLELELRPRLAIILSQPNLAEVGVGAELGNNE